MNGLQGENTPRTQKPKSDADNLSLSEKGRTRSAPSTHATPRPERTRPAPMTDESPERVRPRSGSGPSSQELLQPEDQKRVIKASPRSLTSRGQKPVVEDVNVNLNSLREELTRFGKPLQDELFRLKEALVVEKLAELVGALINEKLAAVVGEAVRNSVKSELETQLNKCRPTSPFKGLAEDTRSQTSSDSGNSIRSKSRMYLRRTFLTCKSSSARVANMHRAEEDEDLVASPTFGGFRQLEDDRSHRGRYTTRSWEGGNHRKVRNMVHANTWSEGSTHQVDRLGRKHTTLPGGLAEETQLSLGTASNISPGEFNSAFDIVAIDERSEISQEDATEACDKEDVFQPLTQTSHRGLQDLKHPLQLEDSGAEFHRAAPRPRNSTGSSIWNCLEVLVQSESFDWYVGVMIVLNAISTGVQADHMARNWTQEIPEALHYCNSFFCWCFVVELLLRALCYGPTFYNYVMRNPLDVIVIILQAFGGIVEICDVLLSTRSVEFSTHSISVLRIARLMRLIRILRLTRILHLIGELRVLIASTLDSLKPLLWTVVLILMITYMFAVYLTQLVTDYKVMNREKVTKEQPLLEQYFGTLDRTALSLYEAVSDGMSWGYFVDPLIQHCSWWYGLLFLLYVTACILGMMNVVTSVFVTGAIKHAEEDKKKVLMQAMQNFFDEADADGSGSISWEEFQDQLEHPQMQRFLKEVDMHPDQARGLFRILDTEGTSEIDITEIVSGCVRLHGHAKAIDLAIMMREHEQLMLEHDKAWALWKEHRDWIQHFLVDRFGTG